MAAAFSERSPFSLPQQEQQLLDRSYRHCRQIARRAASSFYWSFWLLPGEKRRGMMALYAFARIADDLGDSDDPVAVRRQRLDQWRAAFEMSLRGQFEGLLWPALHHTLQRFAIPPEDLFALLDGVAMDLEPCRYEQFEHLRQYCLRVASAVGLACVRIWGYHDAQALNLAAPCGVAMQLTNILRDLGEDAARGRVYLPMEDLVRFGYGIDELRAGVVNDRFRDLLEFEIERTRALFDESQPIVRYLRPDGRRACRFITATYRGLLDEIQHRPTDLFRRRVGLPGHKKAALVLRTLWSCIVPCANRGPL